MLSEAEGGVETSLGLLSRQCHIPFVIPAFFVIPAKAGIQG